MTTPKVERKKIREFMPDPANANTGTERGLRVLDDSLSEVGLGRSAVADKNGIILAGNKTQERAVDRGFEDAIVVHTTGNELVIVQRDDLDLNDLDDHRARKLAYYDNRAGQVGLSWNADQIAADVAAGIDLSDMFTPVEMEAFNAPNPDDWSAAWGGLASGDRAPFQQMTFTLHDEQAEQVKAAIDRAKDVGPFVDSPNENSNGNALARICETYLTMVGEHG